VGGDSNMMQGLCELVLIRACCLGCVAACMPPRPCRCLVPCIICSVLIVANMHVWQVSKQASEHLMAYIFSCSYCTGN
jgi:hypothetical protein